MRKFHCLVIRIRYNFIMGNPLSETVITGTIGELLVQLRLLEYGVQSAPPIKDSGNDLIAIKGEVVKFIQVKTKLNGPRYSKQLPEIYHLLFCVELELGEDGGSFLLDESKITVFNKDGDDLGILNRELVINIWG